MIYLEEGSDICAREVFIMPAYDYECRDCKKTFTVILSLKEFDSKPKVECPDCKKTNVEKKFTAFFAKTDKKS